MKSSHRSGTVLVIVLDIVYSVNNNTFSDFWSYLSDLYLSLILGFFVVVFNLSCSMLLG